MGLIAAGMCLPGAVRAQSVDSLLRKGNQFYTEGNRSEDEAKLKQAVESYSEALKRDPSPLIKYNLGTAQAKLKQYKEAQQTLSEATETQSASQRRDSFFNLGIAQGKPVLEKAREGEQQVQQASPDDLKAQIGSLEESLKSFRHAISDAPDDTEAVYNYEVVKNALRQLEKQQSQQQQPQQDKGDQKDQQKQDQQQNQDQNKDQKDQNKDQQNQQDKNQDQNQQQSQQQNQDQNQKQDQKQSGGLQDQKREQQEQQQKQQQQQGGETGEAQKQPMTPDQMDAARLLNLLEKEKPDQYKRLFQFRDTERKLDKDW